MPRPSLPSFALAISLVVLWGCGGQLTLPSEPLPGESAMAQGISAIHGGERLTIQGQLRGDSVHPFLSLSLDSPFLTGAIATPEVNEHFAAYEMDQSIEATCDNQAIEGISIEGGALTLKGHIEGKGCESDFLLTLTPQGTHHLSLELTLTNPEVNRLSLSIQGLKGERYTGFGEQFSYFDLTDQRVPIWTEEQGLGRGAQPITLGANLAAGAGGGPLTTYAPMSVTVTDKGRSLLLENTEYTVFDLTKDGQATVEVWSNALKGHIFIGDGPLALIEAHTQHSGRYAPLPEWARGTILGIQGGKAPVEAALKGALDAGNPVSAIWIQDWVGRRKTSFGSQLWWRWLPDEESYPDFKNWVTGMNEEGVKVLGYINPFLADVGPLFEEARAKGYLVKNQAGETYVIETAGFPAVLLDLTNPEARVWVKDVIKEHMIGNGLSGWMADFGEWLPFDAVLHSGEDAAAYHNRYPVEWAKVNKEAIAEAGKTGEIVFFTRSGFTGSNGESTLFWAGDQMVAWDRHDGLESSIMGLLSGGVSGMALNHSDIGGYTTISSALKNYHRSEMLFKRWAEANAFTSVFRTHEGNRPELNHQFYSDAQTQAHFAKMGRLHLALHPYFQALEAEAQSKGWPVLRHPWLHYPEDDNTLALRGQFMVGPDLMVYPVLNEKDDTVRGYVPEGVWVNPRNGERFEGPGTFEIAAPLGEPAAFVRGGGDWEEGLTKALVGYDKE